MSQMQQDNHLLYNIEQTPPWYLCILLGFQQYLTMIGGVIATFFVLAPYFCLHLDKEGQVLVISTSMFVCGICTLLQTIIGIRLPLIEGIAGCFIPPIITLLSSKNWLCPNVSSNSSLLVTDSEKREIWQIRIREIQGSLMVCSVLQVVLGASGVLSLILRFIGPLTVIPTITLIALSLFTITANFASTYWWISILTTTLIILFTQFLHRIKIPFFYYSRTGGCQVYYLKFFKMFPIIISITVSWLICIILTATNVLPEDSKIYGYLARTDLKQDIFNKAPWFHFPYPGEWGWPTVSVHGVVVLMTGSLASIVESIGDYHACARLCNLPPPPGHAINRGIAIEGLGGIIGGGWGALAGPTSYSENIAAIGLTKVASRRVFQVTGIILLLLGMIGKFGALFITIPQPVIGGVLWITFGMLTAIGLSNLQFVDLNSSRNLFILGFSLFSGLLIPNWMSNNPGKIKTGNLEIDDILEGMLNTSMFIGGLFGFLLDNIIPGTVEERGLTSWKTSNKSTENECYELPLVIGFIQKISCCRYVPFLPTFLKPKNKKEMSNNRNNTASTNGVALDDLQKDIECETLI